MAPITKIYASLAAEFRVFGARKLVRALAIIGFCNGIPICGLILFTEWRGLNLGGNTSTPIMLILFPTIMQIWEFEGGKASEVALLLICSAANGCFYGVVGVLIMNVTRYLRGRMIGNNA